MGDGNTNLFAEVERIERQADELVEKARAEADEIKTKSAEEVKQLAADTDRRIEESNDWLAEEYKALTDQTLTQIDVEFLKDEEALETAREKQFDELVAWTAARLTEQQTASER